MPPRLGLQFREEHYIKNWDDSSLRYEYLSLMQSLDNLPIPSRIKGDRIPGLASTVLYRTRTEGRKFRQL